MVLSSSSFLTKKQTNPSSKFAIEVMMIALINVKSTWQFRAGNSRTKEDVKSYISDLIGKINISYSL